MAPHGHLLLGGLQPPGGPFRGKERNGMEQRGPGSVFYVDYGIILYIAVHYCTLDGWMDLNYQYNWHTFRYSTILKCIFL